MEILIFSSILSVLYYTEHIITQPLFIWPSLFELSLCVSIYYHHLLLAFLCVWLFIKEPEGFNWNVSRLHSS